MLDVIAPGPAVFEPEEVDVLTAACNLALRKIDGSPGDDELTAEVAKLVHNLGRSRLRHRKRLKDAADAASLAEEAADLLGFLRSAPDFGAPVDCEPGPYRRAVPIFPADVRSPPTSILRPRAPTASTAAEATGGRSAAPDTSGPDSGAKSGSRAKAARGTRSGRRLRPSFNS